MVAKEGIKMYLDDAFKRVLVLSPHADDDVIGCGGLMKKIINNGGEVYVVVTAIGDINFYHLGRVVTKEERKAELAKALTYLGVTEYFTLFDDYESLMDTMPIRNVITSFEKIIGRLKPSAVLLPYPSFHQDHKIVFNAGFAAVRPSPYNHDYLRLVAGYEYPFVFWNNESINGGSLYLDITAELEDKLKAFKYHQSQVREKKHLISSETVALWAEKRGLECGADYAEMFYILRMLIK